MNSALVKIIANIIPIAPWRRKARNFLRREENLMENPCIGECYFPGFYENNDYVHTSGYYNMGISWGEYLLNNNMPKKVAQLRKNLDSKSLSNVDLILSNMTVLPPSFAPGDFMVRRSGLAAFNTEEEKFYQDEHFRNQEKYRREFILDEEIIYFGALTVHVGFENKSRALKKHIAGKDMIVAGAYIGTDTLLFSKIYSTKCTHSFEISAKTRARFLKVMELNHIPKEKWQLVPCGLSDKKSVIRIDDTGNMDTNINVDGESDVQLINLDSYVQESKENLDIGCILLDVEGAALSALRGMADTIRKYRPAVSIGIYHNPEEFFEVKPLFEEIVNDLNYKIVIEKINPNFPQIMTATLFAYPKELDEAGD